MGNGRSAHALINFCSTIDSRLSVCCKLEDHYHINGLVKCSIRYKKVEVMRVLKSSTEKFFMSKTALCIFSLEN